jgi:membrane protein implicated in regulation of membrane protease activity
MFDSGVAALVFWIAIAVAVLALIRDELVDVINGLIRRLQRPPTWTVAGFGAVVRSVFVLSADGRFSTGTVFMRGELWTARGNPGLARKLKIGDRVIVGRLDGLTAVVAGRARPTDGQGTAANGVFRIRTCRPSEGRKNARKERPNHGSENSGGRFPERGSRNIL